MLTRRPNPPTHCTRGQLMSSIGADAVTRAANVAMCADIACALSVEALKGTPRSFEPCIHAVRPHQGQVEVAGRLINLLTPLSEMYSSHNYTGQVQDAYSLRCSPQVHGIVHDTIRFVEGVLDVELNSATDNPMVFSGADGFEIVCGDNATPDDQAAARQEWGGVLKVTDMVQF